MVPIPPLPPAFPPSLPYQEASAWQRRQAAFSAGQLLEPAFPYLNLVDWQRALDTVQPAFYVLADQVLLTHDGLAQVTHYAATAVPAVPRLAISAQPPSGSRKGTRRVTPSAPDGELDAAVMEQLANIRHWRSLSLTQVMNDVLIQGLRHFPDAQRSRIPEGPF